MGRQVRPTKLCLDECLGIAPPTLDEPLHEIDHPLVWLAQTIPPDNGKPVRSLSDRTWWRGKRSGHRVIVTELTEPELAKRDLPAEASWWMGYAGLRRDIYPLLEGRAKRAAKGTAAKANTDFLLPVKWDVDRLTAESEVAAQRALKRFLVEGVAKSLHDGRVYEWEAEHFCISVLVRADSGGEAYLAVGSVGFHLNPRELAVVLSLVPGVKPSDWQAEPSPIAEITPAPGQIVFSTLLPPTVQATILDEFDGAN